MASHDAKILEAGHDTKIVETGHQDKIVEATVNVSELATDAPGTPVDDAESQEPTPDDSTAKKLMSDSWLWEALGLGQFVLCIVAIVIILIVYDGHPLKEWNKYTNISVNTIIAILQQVAMMGMTIPLINCMHQAKWLWFANSERPLAEFLEMDNAKGTAGSIRLLLKPGRRWLISLGAVVTLLTLVYRPFTQQAVTYPTMNVTMVSTSGNTGIEYTLALQDPSALNGFYPMDEHLKQRIQQGVYNTNEYDANNLAYCETHSCVFDDYQSLGVFANASDISSQVITSCDDSHNCLITLPGGPSIFQPKFLRLQSHQSPGCQNTVQLNITTDVLPEGSQSAPSWRYSAWPNLIIHFEMLLVVQDEQCNINASAFDTNIYWSVNTYNVDGWDSKILSLLNLASDVDSWNVSTGTTSTSGNYTRLSYQTMNGTEIFVTDFQTLAVSQYLGTIFNGSASSLQFLGSTWDTETPAAVTSFLYDMAGPNAVSQQNFQAFTIDVHTLTGSTLAPFVNWMNGGILDIGDVDLSITGTPPPQDQAGIYWGSYIVSETIVVVAWPWMTLPFLLTVLMLILLVGTMYQTRKLKLQLWRSSTVPVLRAGSGANAEDGVVLGTNRELDEQTRNVSIALKRDDAGQWRVFTKDLETVASKTMKRRTAGRSAYMKSVKKQVDGVKDKAINEAVDKVEEFAEKLFDNLFSSR